ncbi:DsrE family protein [Sphingomonadaceae bacterium LXI357]|uniref:DsrE family protein n=2 Tax=Stakelama marina TaxID=2826939 RepID=A0A8T4IDZ4_9SPHN|nr:DsrE family protein [Stakelama marina]
MALLACAALVTVATPAAAQMSAFHPGPVFKDFGKIATVDPDMPVPKDTVFKVLFDSHQATDPGKLNRTLESAARFINLQVEAGVPEENIHIAVVLHGPAGMDLTNAKFYAAHHDGKTNASADAVAQLIAHGVRIFICGQSATAMEITKADLLPGVKMALSAMTADALLQQEGYTLNPF